MIKGYYITLALTLLYIVSTIHLFLHNIPYACWFFYGYVIWNILELIYWYFESWTWNEAFRVKDYSNQLVTVDRYYYNPIYGTIHAWLDKDSKWITLAENQKEWLETEYLYLQMFGAVSINIIYIIFYTLIMIVNK